MLVRTEDKTGHYGVISLPEKIKFVGYEFFNYFGVLNNFTKF